MDGSNSHFCTKMYGRTCQNTGENIHEDAEYEQCVCCHKKVCISKDEYIEFRPFYIEGAGQLCYDCYHELYPKNCRD